MGLPPVLLAARLLLLLLLLLLLTARLPRRPLLPLGRPLLLPPLRLCLRLRGPGPRGRPRPRLRPRLRPGLRRCFHADVGGDACGVAEHHGGAPPGRELQPPR